MLDTNFISPIERKILLAITFSICCIFFTDFGNKTIDEYNQKIESEQILKRDHPHARKGEFNLAIDGFLRTHFQILKFQILIVPLILIFLFIRRKLTLLISTILTLFPLTGYFYWLCDSFETYTESPNLIRQNQVLSEFLLWSSSKLEFASAILLLVLFILQTFILIRFVIEQFQVKILNR